MVYARGQPSDFDDWRDLGNHGLGLERCRPHYRGDRAAHRRIAGHHRRVDSGSSTVPGLHRGLRQLGASVHADFNGPNPEGVGIYQITTRGGFRESTATAFLRPALGRPNLQLQLHAHVQRGSTFPGRRAVGVTYRCERAHA